MTERITLEEWVKVVGGRFASLVCLVKHGDRMFAGIRSKNWLPDYHEVPEDQVTLTLKQILRARKVDQ